MSTSDRGLRAVLRVREVRETDARLGLQRARAEETELAAAAARLAAALASGDQLPTQVTGAELASRRTALLGVGAAVTEATTATAAAGRVTEAARAHWQVARSRSRAIGELLERHAMSRREDERRAEDRELDEVSGQAWLRRRAGGTR